MTIKYLIIPIVGFLISILIAIYYEMSRSDATPTIEEEKPEESVIGLSKYIALKPKADKVTPKQGIVPDEELDTLFGENLSYVNDPPPQEELDEVISTNDPQEPLDFSVQERINSRVCLDYNEVESVVQSILRGEIKSRDRESIKKLEATELLDQITTALNGENLLKVQAILHKNNH